MAEIGDVTILIQNAGITCTREILQQNETEIRNIFDVNVLAHFWLLQIFLTKMIENDKGHVVSINSMGGLVSNAIFVSYCSSKFAVRGLMEGLDNEIFEKFNGKSKVNILTLNLNNFLVIFRLNSRQFFHFSLELDSSIMIY